MVKYTIRDARDLERMLADIDFCEAQNRTERQAVLAELDMRRRIKRMRTREEETERSDRGEGRVPVFLV
jgi:hypothetical protein